MSIDEAVAKMDELKAKRDSLFDERHMVSEKDEKVFDAIVIKLAEIESMLPNLQAMQN